MHTDAEALVERYQNSLYTTAFSICKNVQDAEDVVQDTFLQYVAKNKRFESEAHAGAWLFRVAINKARDKNRAARRHGTLPLEEPADPGRFPSEAASELLEAVLALPETYRIVVHLFYYEDYSIKEIAGILRLTPGNVKVRLSRGRALLRSAMKEAWENDE